MSTPLHLRIVEDDARIRELLCSVFLATPGVKLDGSHDSVEETESVDDAHAPDVVLMDVNLPGADGIEGVRRLSARWPGTQFMMYTVNDTDEKVFEALKAGANGYMLKNSNPEQIVQGVRELAAGGSPMSMSVARRVVRHFRPDVPGTSPVREALSEREFNVLAQLAQGLLYKEISTNLGISIGTVKQYIHRIYRKLHVSNRTEAVNRYFER